jgi:hypothetical protein
MQDREDAPMTAKLRGEALLRDPHLNESGAFSEAEREALGLVGLVPEGLDGADGQLQRVLMELAQKPSLLEQYVYLSQLQETDETLFYQMLMSNPARFLPIVYTPTVGDACLEWSRMTRHPRGLYVSIKRRGHVREILSATGRNGKFASSWSLAASGSWALAIMEPMAWVSQWASSFCTRYVLGCPRNSPCPS